MGKVTSKEKGKGEGDGRAGRDSGGLDQIVSGTRVFLDATVFIDLVTGISEQCRRLLERCTAGEVVAQTSTLVIAEVSHRVMMLEAVQRGLVTPGNVVKKIRSKPHIARELSMARQQADRIPRMGVEVLSLGLPHQLFAADLQAIYGLMTNDSLIAATAIRAAVDLLVTSDRDFLRVKELTVVSPTDRLDG